MRKKKSWVLISAILVVFTVALVLLPESMAASQYKVLHAFKGGADGAIPMAGLIFDAAGNLYGTTAGGGDSDLGTVFRLTPNLDGSWTENVLYSFTQTGYDPIAGLVFDTAGNLFGTANQSGDGGAVFKLTRNSDGSWTESVIHSFNTGGDGAFPAGGVTFDTAGNLYGTTSNGGGDLKCPSDDCGIVFKLAPNSDGSWTESVIHRFDFLGGVVPSARVIFDAGGNLYSTTLQGGQSSSLCPSGCGTVFKLTPNADGSWTEGVLHSFTGTDGSEPYAGVTFDADGNLYGTTSAGGAANYGVVFKMRPNPDGTWTEKVIHGFVNNPGAVPHAGVTFDHAGNLYGTTVDGGPEDGGVVFRLAPKSTGSWTYSVLHAFHGTPALHPYGDLLLDKSGNLYGTAADCASSTSCQGVVFQIAP
jgi:uncharacterized repeat protein (TIGR03803 family)